MCCQELPEDLVKTIKMWNMARLSKAKLEVVKHRLTTRGYVAIMKLGDKMHILKAVKDDVDYQRDMIEIPKNKSIQKIFEKMSTDFVI